MQTEMTLAQDRPVPTTDPRRPLSRRQKAAIVVRLLRAEGVELSLADLPDDLQVGLTKEMSAMRYVDRAILRDVVSEFVEELDAIGLAFPSDVTSALSVLDGTISPSAAALLRSQAGLSNNLSPWNRIAELDSARLLPILEEESVEIGAVVLSMLKVSKGGRHPQLRLFLGNSSLSNERN